LQLPHGKVLPHPSPACPQAMFWLAHVCGAQLSGFPVVEPPQTLGVPPPPQIPESQPPHCTTPPHLVSVAAPQLAPSTVQVEGQLSPMLPSPKVATPSPPESEVDMAEESLPELLVTSTDASCPKVLVP
jgi:hypothetical protein